jgi:hypothetical protein
MAVPTYAITLDDLRNFTGDIAGFGRDYHVMNTDQRAKVDRAVESGLHWFYHPVQIPGQRKVHEWSFLHVSETLQLDAPYATGTIAIAANASGSVVTGSGTTFPTWSAQGDLYVSGATYEVKQYDSGTQIILEDTDVTVSSGADYSLRRAWYSLPDNFGHIDGPFTYEGNFHAVWFVEETSYEYIRQLRQIASDAAKPKVFALNMPARTAETNAQEWEVTFHPYANEDRSILYSYSILADKLSSSSAYPLGDASHRETIIMACAAAYEELYQIGRERKESFVERLNRDVKLDQQKRSSDFLRTNRDSSLMFDREGDGAHRGRHSRLGNNDYIATVQGLLPSQF